MKNFTKGITATGLLVASGVMLVVGCSGPTTAQADVPSTFKLISSDNLDVPGGRYGELDIYEDTVTKVEYIVTMTSSGSVSITPRIANDGNQYVTGQ